MCCPATDASCTKTTITALSVELIKVKTKVKGKVKIKTVRKVVRVALKTITIKPGKTDTITVSLTPFGARLLKSTVKGFPTTVVLTAGAKIIAHKVVTITKVPVKKTTTKQ